MSKLEELIEELCPDGVKYIKLEYICDVYDGTHTTPKYTDFGIKFASVENINNPFESDKYISEEDYEKYKIKPQINDILMTRIGSIGVCYVIDRNDDLAYYVSLALLRPNNTIINSKFLKYCIECNHGKKELYKRTLVNAVPIKINKGDIGKITIPIPSLPVQKEIVRILDNFTDLTAELQEKLQEELQARAKQYEYYTQQLLTFDDCNFYSLEDVMTFRNGKGHEKSIVAEGKYIVVNSKFISTNGEVKKYSEEQISPLYVDDILLVMSDLPNGRALARTFLVTEDDKYTLNQRICALSVIDSKKYLTKFLYYYLNRNPQFLRYDNGVDQTNLKKSDILSIEIPDITMDRQIEIVNIFEKLDDLCNSISDGLPAEIEARQKQYEYYRNKLLTFKELGA